MWEETSPSAEEMAYLASYDGGGSFGRIKPRRRIIQLSGIMAEAIRH
jgi:hypothetical protein